VIDTHCHLLWRVDDGPRSAIEAIDLARTLVEQGVSAALCTPHYSPRFPTRQPVVRERFDEFQRDLGELEIPLHAELAAEVSFKLALSVSLEELQERAIGSFLVVELEADAPAGMPISVLDRIAGVGLIPIFAHPERSPEVVADPAALEEARSAGALVQVLASSLAERRGRRVAAGAWAFLDAGRADLLASDAHRAGGTASRLREILHGVARRYGSAVVGELSEHAPARVLGVEVASSG
jgi:protein-tyrosine phosphatase